MSIRPVLETRKAVPAMEGAGVHINRVFGFQDPTELDPFLMMDHFRNDDPAQYEKGFPWHPHRGIETITYVIDGAVEHQDSLGNTGNLKSGDVQWMTAGRGILHQEMPTADANGANHGFQLWANLPRDLKMTDPRYQDVEGKEIPEIIDDDGTKVRIVIGSFWGKTGPVDGISADPMFLDVTVPAGVKKTFPIDTRRRAFAYVFEGDAAFADASQPTGILLEKEVAGEELNIRDMSGDRTLIRFGNGDEVTVQAGEEGVRFLLISGQPIQEPVAWHGPIVMNTQQELQQAFAELRNGTFIKPAH
ncbi:MAG: pirin family protein [Shimia sp.]|uniref:pirin family protein n=1 Tax=Shimia sp. TaxID=1954381 RepID=UPI003B8B96A9